uniref:Uncharacterized protein n=1 Tax=Arundo donax TaxID=35708 RepID=A0A0A9HHE6_ARUDO
MKTLKHNGATHLTSSSTNLHAETRIKHKLQKPDGSTYIATRRPCRLLDVHRNEQSILRKKKTANRARRSVSGNDKSSGSIPTRP